MIEDYTIPAPSIATQKRISEVLGNLDDKIELNRQMNATLEAIARAIFTSWFVDFDPVHAKARGETPAGMDAATAALFPDAFVESELGPIPAGWAIGTLKDCCKRVQNGGTPKRSKPSFWEPAEIRWLKSGAVRKDIVIETEEYISRKGLSNSSAKLWPSGTTVVALYGATAGQVTLLGNEMCANQACCGLVPSEDMRYFLYLRTSESVLSLQRQSRGSAQQNLSQGIVKSFPIIIPSRTLLRKFSEIVQPLFDRWINNLYQSHTLSVLRDTLLPNLVSGRLEV
jgi:type I restriction enzyme S subunit